MPATPANGTPTPDAISRLLDAVSQLQDELRITREESHARHATNARVQAELREAVTRITQLVSEHSTTLLTQGNNLVLVSERLEAHERVLQKLTEQSASNSLLLARHAEALGALKDAVTAAKEWAQDAMRATSELKKSTEDFQQAVTVHVENVVQAVRDETQAVKTELQDVKGAVAPLAANDAAQNQQLTLILHALGVEQEPATGDAKAAPRAKLDQLQRAGKIVAASSTAGVIVLVLKIIYELLKGSH